jgi:hypothetical protein
MMEHFTLAALPEMIMKIAGWKLPFCWIVAYGRYARIVHKGRIVGLMKM